jgi:hypothetical protein
MKTTETVGMGMTAADAILTNSGAKTFLPLTPLSC